MRQTVMWLLEVFSPYSSIHYSYKDKNSCFLSEYPYKFTSELTGKDVVEDDHVEFKIDVDEDDGEVKWFKVGETFN